MSRRSILYIELGLVVLLWVLNFVALKFYLYWTLGWYDIMMHFLGGLTLGVLAIGLFNLEARGRKNFLLIFGFVIILSVGWEVAEYIKGIAVFGDQSYALDTTKDLIMDTIGMVTAYFLILRNQLS